jgi:tRNA G10  N-methylase Trm11
MKKGCFVAYTKGDLDLLYSEECYKIIDNHMQTFALLGAHPNISLAEIEAVTGAKPSWQAAELAIFDDVSWNFSELQDRLGGTQKLGSVVGTVTNVDVKELAAFVGADLIDQVPEAKIHFGVSVYGTDAAKLEKVRTELKNLGFEIKTYLKEAGRSARYVISRDATLSSVVIKNNDLLKKGAEFVFLVRDNDIVIGKTLATQDVDVWSHRDMDRPRRNAKQGMLPPKLARIMANLAAGPGSLVNRTVLDPFCGSGTVLMEAGLLGATRLIGGDIAPIAIADTKANLEWISKESPVAVPDLYNCKASEISEFLGTDAVDTVITETYLGSPRKGAESREDIGKSLSYIETIYRETFANLKPSLKPGATIILTAPIHELDGVELEIDAVGIMTELGYSQVPTSFEPLIYRHQNQLVGRKILIFRA